MKTNKPLKEAILRAPESTEEDKQAQQEQLYHMGDKKSNKAQPRQEDLVNESSKNRIESLHNLRELEYDMEKKKKKR